MFLVVPSTHFGRNNQIYLERLKDLLAVKAGKKLIIREKKDRTVFVEGLTEVRVHSPAELLSVITPAVDRRSTGSTGMNLESRCDAAGVNVIHCGFGGQRARDKKRL
ncbi:kif5 [Symbiodinium sp. KB8]|nr:kif5 [Symbiodinium sp. KB8]